MVDDVHIEQPSAEASAGRCLKNLCCNLSFDSSNYHARYCYPRIVNAAISAGSAPESPFPASQQSTNSPDNEAGKVGTSSSNLPTVSISQGKKMSTSGPEHTSAAADDVAISGALSDTDTAFSEDSVLAELTEVGDGRFAAFPSTSACNNSENDSTYNSDGSSVSTLEGEDSPQFHLGSEGEDGDEERLEKGAKAIPGRRVRKKPGISLIVGSAPLLSDMNYEKLPLDGPSKEKISDCAEGNFFEDREFDFLRAEPVRRSTSLKTYKTPPGTPRRKKAVRFADVLGLDLESVRHILNQQEPPTVPPSAMKDLKVGLEQEHRREGSRYLTAVFSQPGAAPDFPKRVAEGKVVLENCRVDDKDLTVTGIVRVANIGFHKKVIIRYTVNNWLTFEDVCASYIQNSNDGATDRFCFTINVPGYFGVGSKMEFAIMYSANGENFWDSNYGSNYCVECYARALPVSEGDHTWMHFL